MNDERASRDRSIPRAVVALVLLSLITKLALINWNRGEYTDGIIQLQLWKIPVAFFPPLYTLVVGLLDFLVGDPVVTGRLVSMVSCSLVPIPLYLIGCRLGDPRVGLLASMLWVFSPMSNRWGIRVMTDSMFTLTFVITLLFYVRAVLDRRQAAAHALRGMFFWAGISTLVRYHGLIFLVLVLPIMRWRIQYREQRREETPSAERAPGFAWPLPLVLAPWLGLGAWLIVRGFGHLGQFQERASYGLLVTGLAYFYHLEGYLLYLPWAVGYPLAVWIAYALVKLRGRRTPWGLVRTLTISTAVVWLVVQTSFQSFQFRYFLPLLPMWCLMAAHGILGAEQERLLPGKLHRVAVGVTMVWLAVMSGLVVALQRNAFGDITDAARFVARCPATERVFSNEVYREGVGAVKISFWSGRPVASLDPAMLQPGDLVVLHNVYGNLDAYRRLMSTHFDIDVLSRFRRSLLPLLPDIMVFPPGTTSHPAAMAFRFTRQVYETEVLRITARHDQPTP